MGVLAFNSQIDFRIDRLIIIPPPGMNRKSNEGNFKPQYREWLCRVSSHMLLAPVGWLVVGGSAQRVFFGVGFGTEPTQTEWVGRVAIACIIVRTDVIRVRPRTLTLHSCSELRPLDH